MSLKDRLKRLEHWKAVGQPDRIFVHYVGDDFGMCDGERLTMAEWDAIKGDDCVVIHVGYDTPAPVPD